MSDDAVKIGEENPKGKSFVNGPTKTAQATVTIPSPMPIYRIHPAIGIARVGNTMPGSTPQDQAVGPEIPGKAFRGKNGKFRNNATGIFPQAAKFRIFEYVLDQNGKYNRVREVTAHDATIAWTVTLANKKATRTGLRGKELISGPVSVSKGSQSSCEMLITNAPAIFAPLLTYPVKLGTIMYTYEGHLLVIGASGVAVSPQGKSITEFYNNDGWYDDVSDGPVQAKVEINGQIHQAVGAWVIVGPPDFAPYVGNVVTLYDVLFDLFRRKAAVEGVGNGNAFGGAEIKRLHKMDDIIPYVEDDIYPTLKSAFKSVILESGTNIHTSIDLARMNFNKTKIYNRITGQPNTRMPPLHDGDRRHSSSKSQNPLSLTATQLEFFKNWAANNVQRSGLHRFERTSVTPAGLDRAALESCVGGAFFPGIEVSSYIKDMVSSGSMSETNIAYYEPFRIGYDYGETDINKLHKIAGLCTKDLAIPWQADFYDCSGNWWPGQRPVMSLDQNQQLVKWDRLISSRSDMIARWHELDFVDVTDLGQIVLL